MVAAKKELLSILFIFIVSFIGYLANLPSDYYRSLNRHNHRRLLTSLDAFPNTALPYLLIKYKTFEFGKALGAFYLTQDTAKIPYYLININGHYFSKYPIFTGLMAIPIYLIPVLLNKIPGFTYYDSIVNILTLGRIAASLYASLSVLIILLIIRNIKKTIYDNNLDKWDYAFGLFYAFGTTTYSVSSRSLWQHTTAQFIVSLITLYLLKSLKNPKLVYWTGLLSGIAVLCRPTTISLAVIVSIYVLVTHKNYFLKYILFSLPPVAFFIIYNYVIFGSILGNGYQLSGDTKFNGNVLEGIAGLLFSPSRGILFYSTPLFLFIPEIYEIFKKFIKQRFSVINYDILTLFLSIALIFHLIIVSLWWCWWGGDSAGYRMLTEYLPIIGLLSYSAFYKLKNKYRYLMLITMIFSFYVNINLVIFNISRCETPNNWSFDCLLPANEIKELIKHE